MEQERGGGGGGSGARDAGLARSYDLDQSPSRFRQGRSAARDGRGPGGLGPGVRDGEGSPTRWGGPQGYASRNFATLRDSLRSEWGGSQEGGREGRAGDRDRPLAGSVDTLGAFSLSLFSAPSSSY